MTLKNYYQSLKFERPKSPQTLLIEKIAEECDVTTQTAHRWVLGYVTPAKLYRLKIAEITGKPVNELFPNEEELPQQLKS